jgi:hypothetical protein
MDSELRRDEGLELKPLHVGVFYGECGLAGINLSELLAESGKKCEL